MFHSSTHFFPPLQDLPLRHRFLSMGLKIFPVTRDNTPYRGSRGHKDATDDPAQVDAWEEEHPGTLWAFATGEPSNRVVIDFDWRRTERGVIWGLDSLDEAGLPYCLVTTPTVLTRRGFHQHFKWPNALVRSRSPLNLAGQRIEGVDIKADRSCCTLPDGEVRRWDPHLGPELPLASLPWWAIT
jgi:hypothetical protein